LSTDGQMNERTYIWTPTDNETGSIRRSWRSQPKDLNNPTNSYTINDWQNTAMLTRSQAVARVADRTVSEQTI